MSWLKIVLVAATAALACAPASAQFGDTKWTEIEKTLVFTPSKDGIPKGRVAGGSL